MQSSPNTAASIALGGQPATGLTIRQALAGQILAGLASLPGLTMFDRCVPMAVQAADALLAELTAVQPVVPAPPVPAASTVPQVSPAVK